MISSGWILIFSLVRLLASTAEYGIDRRKGDRVTSYWGWGREWQVYCSLVLLIYCIYLAEGDKSIIQYFLQPGESGDRSNRTYPPSLRAPTVCRVVWDTWQDASNEESSGCAQVWGNTCFPSANFFLFCIGYCKWTIDEKSIKWCSLQYPHSCVGRRSSIDNSWRSEDWRGFFRGHRGCLRWGSSVLVYLLKVQRSTSRTFKLHLQALAELSESPSVLQYYEKHLMKSEDKVNFADWSLP